MKRNRLALVMLLSVALALTSCLSNNDDETIYYDDSGITAFALSAVNRYEHTLSSNGADSIVKKTVTVGNYKFYINQETREIYNPDSLPYGTDPAHVLCSVTTRNGGQVAVKNLAGDSLRWFSSSDSIDFTQPRQFVVYSQRGSAMREYTIHVNVHQEQAEEFQWNQLLAQEPNLAAAQRLRIEGVGTKVFAFALENGGQKAFMADLQALIDAANGKTEAYNSIPLDAASIDNVAVRGNEMFVLNGDEMLHFSVDGEGTLTYSSHSAGTMGIARLLGASSTELYAMDHEGALWVSADDGHSWQQEQLDGDAAMLPTKDVRCIVHPLRTNDHMERAMLIGTRPGYDYAEVWLKVVDNTDASRDGHWFRVAEEERGFALPAAYRLAVASYDDRDIAFSASAAGLLSDVLMSKDGGITWHQEPLYSYPSDFGSTGMFDVTSDANNFLWMVCGGTGQVWRGRLNRLGWASETTSFAE